MRLPTRIAMIDYSDDHFQNSVPELTAGSLAELEDLNPSRSITLDFNAFTPNSATNGSVGTYAIIFGPGSTPFSTFVAPGVTSVTVPAGTLLGNTSYSLAIGVNTEFGFAVERQYQLHDRARVRRVGAELSRGAGWADRLPFARCSKRRV